MEFIYNKNNQLAKIEFTDKELDTGVPAAMFNFLTIRSNNIAEYEKVKTQSATERDIAFAKETTIQQRQSLTAQMAIFSNPGFVDFSNLQIPEGGQDDK